MDGVMFSDRVVSRVRVWLMCLAPPITSSEGELDIKLHPLALQLAVSLYKLLGGLFLLKYCVLCIPSRQPVMQYFKNHGNFMILKTVM